MDRNVHPLKAGQHDLVALRKESVDRNRIALAFYNKLGAVALRKESVDRNIFAITCISRHRASLSARRAWIEIPLAEMPAIVSRRSPQGERG